VVSYHVRIVRDSRRHDQHLFESSEGSHKDLAVAETKKTDFGESTKALFWI
jgi:hypothetical protein